MTPAQDPQAACGDDIRLLLADLAASSGTLSEIATVWRRASPYLPGLPAILPGQLHDAASQLAARIQAPAGPAPGPARHTADALARPAPGSGVSWASLWSQFTPHPRVAFN